MSFDHPRSARLLRAADFARLRESSRRLNAAHVTIHYRDNGIDSARLGMAVSRRVSRKAVDRNRIRRQIRESFRLHRAHLPAKDILVVARTSAAQQSNQTLRTDLETLWSRLRHAHGAIEP
jgi:ribonuclease P protein component